MNNMTKNTWLIWASTVSCLIIGLYLTLHAISDKEGEKVRLNSQQLSAISTIIGNASDTLPADQKKVKKLIVHYLEDALAMKNSYEVDSIVSGYQLHQLPAVLPSYNFTTRSFFWLSGKWVLVEVIFWSLFGLIANLMYKVTIAENFDPTRIPEHIGKLFYTPIASLVVYLALSALVNDGSISLDGVSEHAIVLSFILGFFTERTIILIGKIKDIILPQGGDSENPPAPSNPTPLTPEQIAQQALTENESTLSERYPGVILSMAVGTTSDNNVGILATLSSTAPPDFPTSVSTQVNGQTETIPIECTVQAPDAPVEPG